MRYIITTITAVLLLTSCFDEVIPMVDYTPFTADSLVITQDNVDENCIYPEIAEYYENLSIVARWYADHPSFLKEKNINTPLTYNMPLTKLKHIKVKGANGEDCTIFDLDKEELINFLRCWKKIEASEVSQKFRKDPSGKSLIVFQNRNQTFSGIFQNLKSTSVDSDDPFTGVFTETDNQQNASPEKQYTNTNLQNEEYSENDFWKTLIANYNLNYSIIQSGSLQLPAETFINRIRPSIKRGRILLALPGGWSTSTVLVLYPDKQIFDVGHVALFTKDASELGDSITDDISFTIGTSLTYNTNFEQIGRSWLYKHSMAFVCQVCDVRWEAIYAENGEISSWAKIMVDADNEAIYDEVIKYSGIPYCRPDAAFYSKLVAPESFICSSLAWYAVKESTGIIIDDSWGPSIYPVEIFLSENVKIIDDTLD